MSRILFWLGYLWALPVTLFGLLLAAITCNGFQGVFNGALVFSARPWWTKAFFERFHVGAYCWGGTIHIPEATTINIAVIHHELVHFKQARIFGALMPLVYAGCSLAAFAMGGHPYRDNELEKWARKESGR